MIVLRKLARYRSVVAVVLVGIVAAIVGPTWATQSGHRRSGAEPMVVETYADVVEEYQEALLDPELTFPEGVSIPNRPSVPGDADENGTSSRRAPGDDGREMDDDGSRFEQGYGDVEAANAWRCSWEVDMLNAFERNDAQGVRRAENKLDGWYDLTAVKSSVVDPEHRWYRDVVAPTVQGDAQNLRIDVRINCPSGVR